MRGFGSAFSDAMIEVRTRQVGEGVEKAEAEVGDLEKWLKDAPRAANGDVCEPAGVPSVDWCGFCALSVDCALFDCFECFGFPSAL
jgi:hypothetical protein